MSGGKDSGSGTIRPSAYTVDSPKNLCYLVGNCPHCYIFHGRQRLRDQACPLAPQPYELMSERGDERASRYHQEETPRSESAFRLGTPNRIPSSARIPQIFPSLPLLEM
jgi:hypothetical protein